MSWCEPRNLKDWFNRFFSLRCLTFILVILMLAVFEFRFDWIERALGSYLSTTNRQRPETGVIWETAHETQQAQETLEEITNNQEATQSIVRGADDLADIVSLIQDNLHVSISPDRFYTMYKKLPSSLRARILSPMKLLQLQVNQWERTFIQKLGNQLIIIPTDRNNYILDRIVLSESDLVQIERGQVVFEGSLEEWGASPEQIFPADRFFSALNSLPEDAQTEILAQPEQILNAGGRLVRVGFPPPLPTMWVDVGFELADGSRRRVIVLPTREWNLGRLRSFLEDASTEDRPDIPDPEVQIHP